MQWLVTYRHRNKYSDELFEKNHAAVWPGSEQRKPEISEHPLQTPTHGPDGPRVGPKSV
jgi:hypothetical protein